MALKKVIPGRKKEEEEEQGKAKSTSTSKTSSGSSTTLHTANKASAAKPASTSSTTASGTKSTGSTSGSGLWSGLGTKSSGTGSSSTSYGSAAGSTKTGSGSKSGSSKSASSKSSGTNLWQGSGAKTTKTNGKSGVLKKTTQAKKIADKLKSSKDRQKNSGISRIINNGASNPIAPAYDYSANNSVTGKSAAPIKLDTEYTPYTGGYYKQENVPLNRNMDYVSGMTDYLGKSTQAVTDLINDNMYSHNFTGMNKEADTTGRAALNADSGYYNTEILTDDARWARIVEDGRAEGLNYTDEYRQYLISNNLSAGRESYQSYIDSKQRSGVWDTESILNRKPEDIRKIRMGTYEDYRAHNWDNKIGTAPMIDTIGEYYTYDGTLKDPNAGMADPAFANDPRHQSQDMSVSGVDQAVNLLDRYVRGELSFDNMDITEQSLLNSALAHYNKYMGKDMNIDSFRTLVESGELGGAGTYDELQEAFNKAYGAGAMAEYEKRASADYDRYLERKIGNMEFNFNLPGDYTAQDFIADKLFLQMGNADADGNQILNEEGYRINEKGETEQEVSQRVAALSGTSIYEIPDRDAGSEAWDNIQMSEETLGEAKLLQDGMLPEDMRTTNKDMWDWFSNPEYKSPEEKTEIKLQETLDTTLQNNKVKIDRAMASEGALDYRPELGMGLNADMSEEEIKNYYLGGLNGVTEDAVLYDLIMGNQDYDKLMRVANEPTADGAMVQNAQINSALEFYNTNRLEYLTPDERRNVVALLNYENGAKAAKQYISDMKYVLDYRANEKVVEDTEKWTRENPVWSSVLLPVLNTLGSIGGIKNFGSYLLSGEMDNEYGFTTQFNTMANVVKNTTNTMIDESFSDNPKLQKIFRFGYDAISSGWESTAGYFGMGSLYTWAMAFNAFNGSMAENKMSGMNDSSAFWNGVIDGAAEWVSEWDDFNRWEGIMNGRLMGRGLIASIANASIQEAGEEVVGEGIRLLGQGALEYANKYGNAELESAIGMEYASLIGQGYTHAEAVARIRSQEFQQTLYSAAVAGASTILSPQSGGQVVNAIKSNVRAGNAYNGGFGDRIAQFAAEDGIFDQLSKRSQKMLEKLGFRNNGSTDTNTQTNTQTNADTDTQQTESNFRPEAVKPQAVAMDMENAEQENTAAEAEQEEQQGSNFQPEAVKPRAVAMDMESNTEAENDTETDEEENDISMADIEAEEAAQRGKPRSERPQAVAMGMETDTDTDTDTDTENENENETEQPEQTVNKGKLSKSQLGALMRELTYKLDEKSGNVIKDVLGNEFVQQLRDIGMPNVSRSIKQAFVEFVTDPARAEKSGAMQKLQEAGQGVINLAKEYVAKVEGVNEQLTRGWNLLADASQRASDRKAQEEARKARIQADKDRQADIESVEQMAANEIDGGKLKTKLMPEAEAESSEQTYEAALNEAVGLATDGNAKTSTYNGTELGSISTTMNRDGSVNVTVQNENGGTENVSWRNVKLNPADAEKMRTTVAAANILSAAVIDDMGETSAYSNGGVMQAVNNALQGIVSQQVNGQNPVKYASGMAAYVKAGVLGLNYDSTVQDVGLGVLNKAQAQQAYTYGTEIAAAKDATYAAKRGNRSVPTLAAGQSVNVDTSDALANLPNHKLDAHQQATVDAATHIAEVLRVPNLKIQYTTNTDENGNLTGENGHFDANTGTIYLNLNSGATTLAALSKDTFRSAALYTMMHEITHDLKAQLPAQQWNEYKNWVLGTMQRNIGTHGVVNQIRHEMNLLINKGNNRSTDVDINDAVEELVANASQLVLDEITQADINDLATRNPNLLVRLKNAIKDWVSNFLDKIKKVTWGGVSKRGIGIEGVTRALGKDVTELKDQWMKLARNVAHNQQEMQARDEAVNEVLDQAVMMAEEVREEARAEAEEAKKDEVLEQADLPEDVKYSIKTLDDGTQIAWVDEDVIANNSNISAQKAAGIYLKGLIGKVITISEDGRITNIAKDFPDEYRYSKYSGWLAKYDRATAKSRLHMVDAVEDAITIASDGKWENTIHKNNKDAKNGMYRYNTIMGYEAETKDESGTKNRVYHAELLLRHASDNNFYVYDFVELKKDIQLALDLFNQESSILQADAFRDIKSQNASDVNTSETDNVDFGSERHSLKSDDDYMKAVNSGDMETAQRMVDEAAREAGYTQQMYHGTPYGGFTKFRDWNYFTPNREYAERYHNPSASSIRGRYAEATNPMTYSVYIKSENPFDTRGEEAKEIFYNEFYRQWGNGTDLQESGLPDWLDGSDLVEFFEENDYDFDAIYLDEGADGGYGEEVKSRGISMMVKDSAQIKSAEPVVYDDNGDVIPLSERFNADNHDIRYSMKSVDDVAEERFKDSKIRNADGTLMKLYHGTDADFTVFDTNTHDGKTGKAEGFGIYMADLENESDTYGKRKISAYANIKRPATSWQKTIRKPELVKLIKAAAERQAWKMTVDEGYDSIGEAIRDTWISNYVDTYSAPRIDSAYREVADMIISQNDNDKDIVQEIMSGMSIRDYDDANDFYDNVLTPVTGIDGFWTKWDNPNDGTIANIVLALKSNQIKDNSETTFDDDGKAIPVEDRFDSDNPDIRYSLKSTDSTHIDQRTEESVGRNGEDDTLYVQDVERVDRNAADIMRGYYAIAAEILAARASFTQHGHREINMVDGDAVITSGRYSGDSFVDGLVGENGYFRTYEDRDKALAEFQNLRYPNSPYPKNTAANRKLELVLNELLRRGMPASNLVNVMDEDVPMPLRGINADTLYNELLNEFDGAREQSQPTEIEGAPTWLEAIEEYYGDQTEDEFTQIDSGFKSTYGERVDGTTAILHALQNGEATSEEREIIRNYAKHANKLTELYNTMTGYMNERENALEANDTNAMQTAQDRIDTVQNQIVREAKKLTDMEAMDALQKVAERERVAIHKAEQIRREEALEEARRKAKKQIQAERAKNRAKIAELNDHIKELQTAITKAENAADYADDARKADAKAYDRKLLDAQKELDKARRELARAKDKLASRPAINEQRIREAAERRAQRATESRMRRQADDRVDFAVAEQRLADEMHYGRKLNEADSRLREEKAARREDRIKAEEKRKQDIKDRLQHEREVVKERGESTGYRKRIRALIDDFNSRLKNPKKNHYIPVNMVRELVDALEAFDFSYKRNGEYRVSDSIKRIREVYERYKDDPTYPAAYDSGINEHMKTIIDNLGDTRFRELGSDTLKVIYEELRAMHKVITEANTLKALAVSYAAHEAAENLIDETNEANPLLKKGAGARFLNWQISPDNFFARLSGFVKNSTWSKVQKMFVDAEERMLRIQRDYVNLFGDLTKTKDFENLGKFNSKHLVDVGLKDISGKSIKITRGMMLGLYMSLEAQGNTRAMAKGGITIPSMSQYYNGKVKQSYVDAAAARTLGAAQIAAGMRAKKQIVDEATYEDLIAKQTRALMKVKSNIAKMLTENEKKMIANAHNWNDNIMRKQIDEVTLDLYGYKKTLDGHYWAIRRNTDFVNTDFDTVKQDATLANSGFMKERVDSPAPVLLTDFAMEMDQNVNKHSRYVAFVRAERDFNLIYNGRLSGNIDSVKNAVGRKFGAGNTTLGVTGTQYIEKYISDIVGNTQNGEQSIFAAIRRQLPRATLSLNFRVALSQVASVPTAAAELDWMSMVKGMPKGLKMAFSTKAKNQLANDDPWFFQRYRGEGGMTEFADIKAGSNAIDRAYNKVAGSKIGSHLLNWCQDFDVAATAMIHAMTEDYVQRHTNLRPGTHEFDAAVSAKYRDVLRRTQPMYMTTSRSALMRNNNELMKMFTMYKTQAAQNANILYDSIARLVKYQQDFKKNKNGVTAQDVAEARKRFLYSYTAIPVAAMVFAAFRAIANFAMQSIKKYRDDNDELTAASVLTAITDEAVASMASMVVFGNDLYTLIESQITGNKYYGIEESALKQVENLVDKATKLATDSYSESETPLLDFRDNSMDLMTDIAESFGIPVKNANRFVDAGTAWFSDIISGNVGSFASDVARKKGVDYRRLVQAELAGDTAKYDSVRNDLATGEGDYDPQSDKQIEKGIQDELADLYKSGKLTRDKAISMLTEHGLKASEAEVKLGKIDYEKATHRKYSKLEDDFTAGLITYDQTVEYMVKYGGYTEAKAKEKLNKLRYELDTGRDKDDFKADLAAGKISKADAIQYQQEYFGMTKDEAERYVAKQDFANATGGDTTIAAWELYYMQQYKGMSTAEAKEYYFVQNPDKTEEQWQKSQSKPSKETKAHAAYWNEVQNGNPVGAGAVAVKNGASVSKAMSWSKSYYSGLLSNDALSESERESIIREAAQAICNFTDYKLDEEIAYVRANY